MKNLLKKVLVLVLALSCALGAFAGCGDYGEPEEEVDPNRRQIYVSMFTGGQGIEWLKNDLKYKYEATHPDIQIMVDGNYRDSVYSEMPGLETDIFINERDSYELFATSGNLADIGEWVTEDVYDENYNYVGKDSGTVSIKDRMPESFANFYNKNGAYYGTPFYEGTFGIYYDADLFEEEGWYDNGNGPDGVANTPDDGLPSTWQDFVRLIAKVKNAGITPFCFSNLGYIIYGIYGAVWAHYEGKNNFDINFTFSGTDSNLGEINANPGTANFVELQKQEGRRAALTFYNEILKTGNQSYTTRVGQSHTDAQAEFVQGIQTGNRCAMFLEANYWQNEARATFEALEGIDEDWGYTKRNFKFMPFPRFVGNDGTSVPAQTNTKNTLFSTGSDSFIFVNGARVKTGAEAATDVHTQDVKEFYQYLNSNIGCTTFTKYSGCFRTLKFKMSPEALSECTVLTQDMYEYRFHETSEMCYELSTCTTRVNQYETFLRFDLNTKLSNGIVKADVFAHFKTNNGVEHVNDYFEGLYRYWTTVANFQVLG